MSGFSKGQSQIELECQCFFLDFASGKFGRDLVLDFLCILTHRYKDHLSEGMGPSETHAEVLFCAVLFGMGECWRRFVAETDAYPWKIFELCGMSEAEFWNHCSELKGSCRECLDIEFTQGLVDSFRSEPSQAMRVQVTDFLKDLAVHIPLSTDAVEAVHGQLQNVFQKFRGRAKLASACSERAVLHSLVSEHANLLHKVKLKTLPNADKVQKIQRPAPSYRFAEKPPRKKLGRKFRNICGWNVFLRQGLANVKLSKAAHKAQEQQLAARWKSMSVEEQTPFNVRATYETAQREKWLATPLPVGRAKEAAVEEVGQKMVHKMNFDRLALNFKLLENHPGWRGGLGLSDSKGGLKADLIEQEMTDAQIAAELMAKMKCLHETDVCTVADNFRGTCKSRFGRCRHSEHFDIVEKLEKSFTQHVRRLDLRSGALLQFYPPNSNPNAGDSLTLFLATSVLRPSLHVFLLATMLPDSRVRIEVLDNSKIPDFMLSCQLFHMLLGLQGGSECEKMCVQELEYAWNPIGEIEEGLQHGVEVRVLKEGRSFVLNEKAKRRAGKRKKKLPFGADMLRKLQKQQSLSQKASQKQVSNARVAAVSKLAEAGAVAQRRQESAAAMGHEESSSSSSPRKLDNDTDSNSDSENDRNDDMEMEEDDVVVGPCPASDANACEVLPVAVDLLQEQEKQVQLAEVSHGPEAQSSTFFSKEIGFSHEADLAKTSRSTCLHCKEKILKGSPRYPYHYSRYRPYSWVHSDCVLPFVNVDPIQRKAQALSKMRMIVSCCEIPDVASTTRKLIQLLA